MADALASVLRIPSGDVFGREVVAVPARGVERWLTQRLSHRLGAGSAAAGDGVCANIAFPSPTAIVVAAVEVATGMTVGDDPWRVERLTWPLLDVIDQCLGQPWCPTLSHYLGAGAGVPPDVAARKQGRRYATSAKLAGLFTGYAAARPEMLRDWAGGRDTDGAGQDLDEHTRWQAELWRRVRSEIAVPNPAERLPQACAALADDPDLVDLPPRLSVFGLTRVTRDALSVFEALARHRDVHLWLPHPSPALWQRISALAPDGLPRRAGDPSARLGTHPLLSSLGRDSRELQLVIATGAPDAKHHHHRSPDAPAATTLLARLQEGLSTDALPLDPDQRPTVAPGDRSVSVHACHGRSRQVEVLREVILGLLADDTTLEPRDVLVMCPDIEVFAPLITAAFGVEPPGGDQTGSGHPGHLLRVRLADRSLRATNPLLAVADMVLTMAGSRVSATEVLDLLAMPAVRYRFGFDDDDIERIRAWVSESGVRWGIDATHRGQHGSAAFAHNTWRAAMDRLLISVAMTADDQRFLGLAIALDDVDSADIDLVGRFAEFVDRLVTAVRALSGRHPVTWWLTMLADAVTALAAVPDTADWQRAQTDAEWADVATAAAGSSPHLVLADVVAVLRERLGGRPTRANFRTGDLTACSLVPMRSVPHRVVCLLGMDDGAFARGGASDGDDILAVDPVVGERDRRSEARQMVLDAVMSARDHLVVVYSGADERTGARLPPAVPIGELLDAADLTCRVVDGTVRDRLVVRHPLQPYDPRNFTQGDLGADTGFSFDPLAAAGARVLRRPRDRVERFLSAPLPPISTVSVSLVELIGFVENPVRAFVRNRLGAEASTAVDRLATDLSVEVSGLDRWAIGDRLLRARLGGADLESCRQAEWRRGTLPPGRLGASVLDTVIAEVEPLVQAGGDLLAERSPGTRDVTVALPGGRVVTGTVPGIHDTVIGRVEYSRLGAKHRLRAWVQVLALAAGGVDTVRWSAATIGRRSSTSLRGRPGQPERSSLTAPSPADALALLGDLVDLFDVGMTEPLPLATKSSYRYAIERAGGLDAMAATARAAGEWSMRSGDGQQMGESVAAEHVLVWGPDAAFEVLTASAAGPADGGLTRPVEPHRFGVLAQRLWQPLLAAEVVDRL